jgi:hypothetical protein
MTKEQLEKMIDETSEKFNKLAEEVEVRQNIINEKQQEILALLDEQKRLQGEYRLLVKLGTDCHYFDEEVTESADIKPTSQEIEV